MKIVPYQDKYKKQIIQFLKEVTIDEFGFKEWDDYLTNKDFSPYHKQDSMFLLLRIENKIIGTIGGLKVDNNTIKLNSFYIKKEYRNKKLGMLLYQLFYNFAQKYYKEIILCTYNIFSIATQFYEKQGFVLYKQEGKELWMKKIIKK